MKFITKKWSRIISTLLLPLFGLVLYGCGGGDESGIANVPVVVVVPVVVIVPDVTVDLIPPRSLSLAMIPGQRDVYFGALVMKSNKTDKGYYISSFEIGDNTLSKSISHVYMREVQKDRSLGARIDLQLVTGDKGKAELRFDYPWYVFGVQEYAMYVDVDVEAAKQASSVVFALGEVTNRDIGILAVGNGSASATVGSRDGYILPEVTTGDKAYIQSQGEQVYRKASLYCPCESKVNCSDVSVSFYNSDPYQLVYMRMGAFTMYVESYCVSVGKDFNYCSFSAPSLVLVPGQTVDFEIYSYPTDGRNFSSLSVYDMQMKIGEVTVSPIKPKNPALFVSSGNTGV